eukprot:Skav229426  [mRNA]  locus=scaffold2297:298070:298431:+ [translate_table: standard]
MMRAIQASEATEQELAPGSSHGAGALLLSDPHSPGPRVQEVKVMAQCLREKSLRGQDLLLGSAKEL